MRRHNKYLVGGIRDTGQQLPYRDPNAVDGIVGKKRNAYQVGTGFFEWPLWQHYRTWVQYLDEVASKKGKK